MGKTPATSRKALTKSAPYQRSASSEAVAPVPVVVPEPAPVAAAPTPVPVALPAPVAAPALADFDLLAIARTSLAFCDAALGTLPAPADITAGDPTTPEPPPGLVPPGDSRSLRQADQFALVYRHGAAVITRKGQIGQRGSWRVIDYPSPIQAANAYAAECSRLLGMGFADLAG